MTKLKPCPFCENNALFMSYYPKYDHVAQRTTGRYSLVCMNCELHGPLAYYKKDACFKWNLLPRKKETK